MEVLTTYKKIDALSFIIILKMPRRRCFYKSLTYLQIAQIKNKTHLKYFPPDVIKRISAFLSLEDFGKFKLTCKYVYRALKMFKLYSCPGCNGWGTFGGVAKVEKYIGIRLNYHICQTCFGCQVLIGLERSTGVIPIWKIYDVQPDDSIPYQPIPRFIYDHEINQRFPNRFYEDITFEEYENMLRQMDNKEYEASCNTFLYKK